MDYKSAVLFMSTNMGLGEGRTAPRLEGSTHAVVADGYRISLDDHRG